MKAQAIKNELIFVPVPKIRDVDVAFGLDGEYFFDRKELPDVPKKYTEMAQDLFFKGGMIPEFQDVDRVDACKFLKGLLTSMDTSHESKVTTVGYALWAWIEGVE